MDFCCSNCDDAITHAVYRREANPFEDPFYHFCNNCNNPTAKLKYQRLKDLKERNDVISGTTRSQ
jgi:hypothetical protein